MVSDAKILAPYLAQVMPGLQDCLLDPIPDVRATSAKALGSLCVGMGEEQEELQRLVPWLSKTLCSESSPVERSGTSLRCDFVDESSSCVLLMFFMLTFCVANLTFFAQELLKVWRKFAAVVRWSRNAFAKFCSPWCACSNNPVLQAERVYFGFSRSCQLRFTKLSLPISPLHYLLFLQASVMRTKGKHLF
jgi:hypothetical protein